MISRQSCEPIRRRRQVQFAVEVAALLEEHGGLLPRGIHLLGYVLLPKAAGDLFRFVRRRRQLHRRPFATAAGVDAALSPPRPARPSSAPA